MAILHDPRQPPPVQITDQVRQACEDYRHYIESILQPAGEEFGGLVRTDNVKLHQAYSVNLMLAHCVDYLHAIRKAIGISEKRGDLIKTFDEKFYVDGAYIRNRKMELIDAINNALKHIRLDPDRYKRIESEYGKISFKALVQGEGIVICHLDNYRFDYCRVVLLPALDALVNWKFEDTEDVLQFAQGAWRHYETIAYSDYDDDDPSTAIDRMIEICSSPCRNCEEDADKCRCSEYIFANEEGHYEPLHSVSEEQFDSIMNLISPSYSRS